MTTKLARFLLAAALLLLVTACSDRAAAVRDNAGADAAGAHAVQGWGNP